jgi:putative transposase
MMTRPTIAATFLPQAAFSSPSPRRHPFTIDAMVVLPDHLHAIRTLPAGDADFSTRWRLIKSAFSRSLPIGERLSPSRAANPVKHLGGRCHG